MRNLKLDAHKGEERFNLFSIIFVKHLLHSNRQGIFVYVNAFLHFIQKCIRQPDYGAPLYQAFHFVMIATLLGYGCVFSHLDTHTFSWSSFPS